MSMVETRNDTPSIHPEYAVSGFCNPGASDLESKLDTFKNPVDDKPQDRAHVTVRYTGKNGQACSVDVDILRVERMGPRKYVFRGTAANAGWNVVVIIDFNDGQGTLVLSA